MITEFMQHMSQAFPIQQGKHLKSHTISYNEKDGNLILGIWCPAKGWRQFSMDELDFADPAKAEADIKAILEIEKE